MFFKKYRNAKGAGWMGWIENRQGTAVAFVKPSGQIVWDW